MPLASRRHFYAIFVFALTVIAFQILLTRYLSVIFYFHMAFAGITFAMLGLTAGALKVFLEPQRFTHEKLDSALARYGAHFALAFVAGILCMSIKWLIALGFSLATALPLLLYSFFCGGVCVALLLTRYPAQTGKLYAADLVGASLGCIVVIAMLKILDPFSALFLLAAMLLITAALLMPQRKIYAALAGVLLLSSAVQTGLYLNGSGGLRISWAKGWFVEEPLFERWNTYSRVSVVPHHDDKPFGWGFGIEHPPTTVKQLHLAIDADAGTVLTNFDGDTNKISYLKDDVINLGYHVRPSDSAAVIGIGGGRDILSGIVFGAKKITGVELNPAVFEALTRRFGDFTGHLDTIPGINLVNAEARTYFSASGEHFDSLQISLIDTWAATASGGLTLSENKLYTKEAWQEFLGRMNDDGILMVSRWFSPGENEGEFYRLLSLATHALKGGFGITDPRGHILAAASPKGEFFSGVVTVITSRTPFTEAELARFYAQVKRMNLTVLLAPGVAYDATAETIASGNADADFYAAFPYDISPSTDDKPFFFYMTPLSKAFSAAASQKNAITVLLTAALVTLVASIVMIGLPLMRAGREQRKGLSQAGPHLLYFTCIGLGFMFIEIAQMQRLMIFLGHPVYGLSVVLFTLLLFGGLGSYTVDSGKFAPRSAWHRSLVLLAVLGIIGAATPEIIAQFKYLETPWRIALSIALLAPAGFCMGWMFPLGTAMIRQKSAHLLPWFWGANGAASVLASVAAVIASLSFGISATFWMGVACYAVCSLLLVPGKEGGRTA